MTTNIESVNSKGHHLYYIYKMIGILRLSAKEYDSKTIQTLDLVYNQLKTNKLDHLSPQTTIHTITTTLSNNFEQLKIEGDSWTKLPIIINIYDGLKRLLTLTNIRCYFEFWEKTLLNCHVAEYFPSDDEYIPKKNIKIIPDDPTLTKSTPTKTSKIQTKKYWVEDPVKDEEYYRLFAPNVDVDIDNYNSDDEDIEYIYNTFMNAYIDVCSALVYVNKGSLQNPTLNLDKKDKKDKNSIATMDINKKTITFFQGLKVNEMCFINGMKFSKQYNMFYDTKTKFVYKNSGTFSDPKVDLSNGKIGKMYSNLYDMDLDQTQKLKFKF